MARTTALNKIEKALYEPTFYKVIQGGMSAGKTYAIITLLIGYAESYPNSVITVVGVSHPHLEGGAIRDFVAIMKQQGRWNDNRWNIAKSTYAFLNDSLIEFKSIDRMSARGPRREVLFVNEANGLPWDTFEQLANRTRDFVIVDYNPSAEFWVHTELADGQFAHDTTFLILTYKDNEALDERGIKNIENHRPKPGEQPSNWWTVYGLGQVGTLEGNIYAGWEEVDAETVQSGQLVRYGLDFGFSNDETALVAIYELTDGRLGVEELYYKTDLLGSQYPAMLDTVGVDPSVLIVADSARPEIIAEIKQAGWRCARPSGCLLRRKSQAGVSKLPVAEKTERGGDRRTTRRQRPPTRRIEICRGRSEASSV